MYTNKFGPSNVINAVLYKKKKYCKDHTGDPRCDLEIHLKNAEKGIGLGGISRADAGDHGENGKKHRKPFAC